MAKRYDVIVVGAGPAGLMAARTVIIDMRIQKQKDWIEQGC